ncbi:MAG: DUF692 family multinuclear iron-containing protein [Planctomycetota bacterium]
MSADPASTRIGFMLMPEQRWLELCTHLLEGPLVDLIGVTPEALWKKGPDDSIVPNGFHKFAAELRARCGKPFVGHGVGYSVGSAPSGPPDERRRNAWRAQLEADRKTFAFEHYTDHLGFTSIGELNLDLPLPIPQDDAVADLVRARLLELRSVAPRIGVENSAFYFALGDPLEEPAFLERCLAHEDLFLLLDVHNLWTNGLNLGFEPEAWLGRLDLRLVEEIHVSGGSWSDPAWLRQGGSLRLDSHEDVVPEPVFRLLESVVPRCPNLRVVTLERMEGTVAERDVAVLESELGRIRAIVASSGDRRPESKPWVTPREPRPVTESLRRLQEGFAAVFHDRDPVEAVRRLAEDQRLPNTWRDALRSANPTGIELSDALIAQLRLSRVCNGSRELHQRLLTDPRRFAEEFERYRLAVPPTRWHPVDEARACSHFLAR